MAEYKYVDWPGLQYYHSKVTDLIDSRLRQCIRFGEETLYVDLQSPDTNDLNIVIRVIDSFTVRPSDNWFDETLWNNTYPAGTLLQVVQKSSGVVYTVFLQPANNSGGGGSTPEVDLSNYYTKDEVDAKILEALRPYATVEFVTAKLDAIQELLDAQIDNFGKLSARVTNVEKTLETTISPAITQLEAAIDTLATKEQVADIDEDLQQYKADMQGYRQDILNNKNKIESIENDLRYNNYNFATETFVSDAIADAQLSGSDIDLSNYATKQDIAELASESYVDEKISTIEIPEVPTKVSQLENDTGYLTEHQDISGKADVDHKHSISDITDYSEPDLSEYAKKEDIPEVDLSNFYNKTEVENIVDEAVGNIKVPEVPTNVSAFVNDAGYITEKDLPDLSEYAKLSDIPNTDKFATQDFVKQKIAEAQLSGGDVDLSVFYTKEEVDAKGFATEEYVQSVMDDADVVGMDTRITELENQSNSVDTRLNEIEDQADENSASLTALDGEIDRIDATILTMDTQITNISQNLADLQAYGTF